MNLSYADRPWTKHYDDNVSAEVEVPNTPLHRFLEEAAAQAPNQTAVIFKGKTLTYRELNEGADHIAAGLAASGFKKGDRAVVYMPNLPQFIMAFFGILKAGGIVIATNPLYTERELTHQLSDCGAETVFVMSPYYKLLKKVQRSGKTNVKRIVVTNVKEYFPRKLNILFTLLKEKKDGHRVKLEDSDMSFQDFLELGKRSPKADVDVSGEDQALLQYTGGTTGLSKGAIALHRNLASNVLMIRSWIPDWEFGKETFVSSIPFFHSYGLVTAMCFPISIQAKMIVIVDPRDQKDLLSSIQKYKATYFPGVPAMYVSINHNPDVESGKYDITSIKACVSGSAPLLLETKRQFEALTGGKLVEGYGLTEAHVVTHANPLYGENREGSIGLPICNVEARIVDAVDGVNEMPVGGVGELIVRGPNIMAGYWNMPDETERALRDGWLYTGDIARMDEEGYFYIEDRKKDLIIAGGYNIYPREVEEVLVRHPAVMEACVAGVPDPKRGETVKAWIVKKEGDATTEDEIKAWSKTQLAAYKYPRMIEFRDELPKSSVGKILKRELVKEYKEGMVSA